MKLKSVLVIGVIWDLLLLTGLAFGVMHSHLFLALFCLLGLIADGYGLHKAGII
jgi:hypothetical protein